MHNFREVQIVHLIEVLIEFPHPIFDALPLCQLKKNNSFLCMLNFGLTSIQFCIPFLETQQPKLPEH
jgi:hypothetical protein